MSEGKVFKMRPRAQTNASVWLVFLVTGVAAASAGDSLRFDFSPDPLERFRKRAALRLECPPASVPPAIDGRLGEGVWQEAGVIDRLSKPKPDTTVRVCADAHALYLGVSCVNRAGKSPQAKEHDRDGPVWRDDCIEVWIQPDRGRVASYQFVVNAANSRFDALRIAGRSKASHDPRWAHAVSTDESAWTVEMAIPFAAVGLKEWRRELGFNIGRNGPGVGARSWSPQYGGTGGSVLVLPDAPEVSAVEKAKEALTEDAKVMTEGDSLRVAFERLHARPGERWIEASVHVRPKRTALKECQLKAALFRPGSSEPVDRQAVKVDRDRGVLAVDLRRHRLRNAELLVELHEGETRTGLVKTFLSVRESEQPLAPKTRIPIHIDIPAGVDQVAGWPVTFGVPFAPGRLWDVGGLRMVDSRGSRLPAQTEAVGRWAVDGAVKWVRFDALVNSADGCSVEIAAAPEEVGLQKSLALERQGDDIVVTTGPTRYRLGRGVSPIKEIRIGDRLVATSDGTRGLYVVDQNGTVASASADGEDMRVEASGPVAACVRFEGFYRTEAGKQLGRHITRVELFLGQPFAKVTHTFTITNDTNEIWLKDMGWELAVMPGREQRASFGISRDDWLKSKTAEVGDATLSMLQDRHYCLGHGENHCSVDRIDANGKAEPILEGEECGDWAALTGADGGLMVSCRETARQHPKELVASRDKLLLRLFSPRGGEELDFRMPALVKRWDLKKWHEGSTSESRRGPIIEKALANKSNAIGWSKTHYLTFAPLAPNRPIEEVARLSRLTSAQVYAQVDPNWIYESRAMGMIHPKDAERFPEVERAIDAAFRYWADRIDSWGDYGFVDYFNGPHLGYRGKYVVQKRYSKNMYTLKQDLWLLYARSADRRVRTFIENVARTFMDVDAAQWDGDGKIKGLFHSVGGGDLTLGHPNNLPMPWAGSARFHYSSTTNMDLIAWDYYLTGNRRAKDAVFDFAEGAKRFWTPNGAARDGRSLMVFRSLVQTYGFTWDPVIRAIAEATTDQFYDPTCELALTKNRPYSSTYKTQVDIRAIEDGWSILGGRRYREMMMKMARRWWGPLLGAWPHFYCNPQGRAGSLLYEETGAAHIPQALAVQMRYSASAYDPEKDHTFGCEGAANATFVFEGLPYSMAMIARSGADREPTASWIGYEDFGYPSSIVVWKGDEESMVLHVRTAGQSKASVGKVLSQAVELSLVNSKTRYGLDLHQLRQTSTGYAMLRLPKDAPEGAYEIAFKGSGFHICFADSRVPMVVHAPRYWRPAPAQQPTVRYYFSLPEGTEDGQLFFEGSARLLDPDGQPWPTEEPQHGWVTLPADRPGLWSFRPVENEIVGSRNIPPFFAAESASSYFDPGLTWVRRPAPELQRPDPALVFADGAIQTDGNQAVHLIGKRIIRLAGGEPHPSGDGLRFLPFKQGTIEFWMKPSWHTCELRPKGFKRLVTMNVAKGSGWQLSHYVAPRARNSYHDFLFSHVLYGWFYSDGLAKRSTLRRYRRTIFEPGEWTHVAWVWGLRDGIVPGNPPYHTKAQKDVLISAIFINGQQGSNTGYRWYKNLPVEMPTSLEIGRSYASANIDALVDELRISDVQRYTSDFKPSRESELEVDEHTRALFHLNGDLAGQGASGQEAAVQLTP